MARGWESKSVEMQIESRVATRTEDPTPRHPPEEIARMKERASLDLSRKRVLNDLQTAVNPRYREILAASLDFLDQKLKLLDRR